jgi:hypothetical protein
MTSKPLYPALQAPEDPSAIGQEKEKRKKKFFSTIPR